MARVARWTLRVGAVLLGLFVVLAYVTALPGDPALYPPKPSERPIVVRVVSHGYHSGLILPRADVARVASQDSLTGLLSVATRFEAYDYLEFGWGADEFYRSVPELTLATMPHALRALAGLSSASVLHIVGFNGAPERVFHVSPMLAIDVGEGGFRRLADRVDESVGRDRIGGAVFLGPGLYGPSLFVRSHGAFHIGSVCNHWVARALNAAGAPVVMALAAHPVGLFADLTWRGGARRVDVPS